MSSVPDVDEVASSVERAGRVLDEIAYRDSEQDLHEADRGVNSPAGTTTTRQPRLAQTTETLMPMASTEARQTPE
ncbi:hypothetical protein HBB16_04935 [Pseudonocardia sp. MCCB 268]|nr:hypothetical protein [Pseudonocardia cytotoxica]